MKYFILFFLMVSFVSAVNVDFDCPNEIFVDEEFECSLEVFDGSGEYDVKVDLDSERNSVLEVWNGEAWKSGYYYLLEFIEDGDEKNVRLKVSEEGDYEGVLKLRQGDKREFFDIELEVDEGEETEEKEMLGEKIKNIVKESKPKEIVLSLEPSKTIPLNGDVYSELIYESKDAKIIDYLPFAFGVFLIITIGAFIWKGIV